MSLFDLACKCVPQAVAYSLSPAAIEPFREVAFRDREIGLGSVGPAMETRRLSARQAEPLRERIDPSAMRWQDRLQPE